MKNKQRTGQKSLLIKYFRFSMLASLFFILNSCHTEPVIEKKVSAKAKPKPKLEKPRITRRSNFFANPSFERVEPPRLTKANHGKTNFDAKELVPRCWHISAWSGGKVTCPLDEKLAKTGSRCLKFMAKKGVCRLSCQPLPPFNDKRTIRFFARGEGALNASASALNKGKWKKLNTQKYLLTPNWKEYSFKCPEGNCGESWRFELRTLGKTIAELDDFSLSCPEAKLDGLATRHPLWKDEDSLLYLDFETPLDPFSYFVKGEVTYPKNEMPGFGKAFKQGRGACVAGDAEETINCKRGTIECWVKLLSPGDDRQNRSFLRVPGMNGMSFGKDKYGHLSFGFSYAWRPLGRLCLKGKANSWRSGVWHHVAVTWDKDMIQYFIDGSLAGWTLNPKLPKILGGILEIGSPGIVLDDLRVSKTVRYRVPVPNQVK